MEDSRLTLLEPKTEPENEVHYCNCCRKVVVEIKGECCWRCEQIWPQYKEYNLSINNQKGLEKLEKS